MPIRKALIAAIVPDKVIDVPPPVTVTPPPVTAASVPDGTLSVVVTAIAPEAESGSLTAKPVSCVGDPALTVCPGKVLTGASLTAVTVTLTLLVSWTPPDPTV